MVIGDCRGFWVGVGRQCLLVNFGRRIRAGKLRFVETKFFRNNINGIELNSILQKIVDHKRSEIGTAKVQRPIDELMRQASQAADPIDFVDALRQESGVALIAEVKKASPSKGVIRGDFDPVAIAKAYADAGAACISVLTDEHFFQGHLDFLRAIRLVVSKPLLRKDFIIDDYQVFEARAAGADAVLLIAECLQDQQLIDLHRLIVELGMTPLVELYDQANVAKVLSADPVLVGVNNRDLNTFEVDLHHSVKVKQLLPPSITFVSESGIEDFAAVQMLEKSGVDAMLVGESLMRADDVASAVRALLGK